MQFAGLLEENPSEANEDVYGQNRSELAAILALFLAVIRRCKVADPSLSSGVPFTKSPASKLFLKYFCPSSPS